MRSSRGEQNAHQHKHERSPQRVDPPQDDDDAMEAKVETSLYAAHALPTDGTFSPA